MRSIVISSHSRYPVDRRDIRRRIVKTLAKYGLKTDYRVHIMVIGDRQMAELNKRYMGRDGTADVLSFPLIEFNHQEKEDDRFWPKEAENSILDLGEIVVSYPQAKNQAIKKNITMDDQISFLVAHGIDHLMGKHHEC